MIIMVSHVVDYGKWLPGEFNRDLFVEKWEKFIPGKIKFEYSPEEDSIILTNIEGLTNLDIPYDDYLKALDLKIEEIISCSHDFELIGNPWIIGLDANKKPIFAQLKECKKCNFSYDDITPRTIKRYIVLTINNTKFAGQKIVIDLKINKCEIIRE